MRKDTATALEAALRYAGAGYAVVPLLPRDKRPRVKNWTECASTDSAQLERWFTKWPDSNLGLMPPEGCIVIDVDPRNGGDPTLLRLPKNTPTQRTGGGGWHFVVRVDPGVELPALPGVDYIHPGRQQFCAWPSVHPNGKRYEWVKGLEPWTVKPTRWRPYKAASRGPVPAQAPAGGSQPGDLAPIPTTKPPSYTLARLRTLAFAVHGLDPDRWGNGKHDAWLRELVAPVHHETRGSAEGLALAHEVSALFGHYDSHVLDTKWRSFGKTPRDKLRTGASLERALRNLLSPSSKPPTSPLAVHNASALSRKDLPRATVLVDGLVTSGLMLLSGQPKVGKSWLVLDLILSLGHGSAFWGRKVTKPCKVLYLALEDNERRLKSRLDQLWVEGAGEAAFQYMLEAPRVNDGLDAHLRSQIEQHAFDVVVIDSLAMVRPIDAQARLSAWQGDYQGVQAIKAIADDLNVAVIVITHNSKQGSQGAAAQNAISATGGLMAGVDGWWVLEHTGRQTEDAVSIVKLTVEHRDLMGGEFAVTFDRKSARWQMLGSFTDVTRGSTQAAIVSALRASRHGLTAKELADAIGKGRDAVAMCLTRMRKDGLISTTADGKNRLAP